jgi:dTDP-4-dehydrorhamnose 3,5-epimerase-like enzyme
MGISILDKNLNLKLPKKKFILSKKDKKNITLKEFIKKYKSL